MQLRYDCIVMLELFVVDFFLQKKQIGKPCFSVPICIRYAMFIEMILWDFSRCSCIGVIVSFSRRSSLEGVNVFKTSGLLQFFVKNFQWNLIQSLHSVFEVLQFSPLVLVHCFCSILNTFFARGAFLCLWMGSSATKLSFASSG